MAVLVGKKAPDFSVSAVVDGGIFANDFTLEQFRGKYVILFFYPKDFTFVCPSELHAFQAKLDEFKSKGCEVIACSTDTEQSHWGWLQVPKAKGGIEGIKYPILADTNKTISHAYDVLGGAYYADEDDQLQADGEMVAYRGLFLIDKEGIVKHQLVNDNSIGRSVEEAMRALDALIFTEENGEVCPANWMAGKEGMSATHDGVADYLSKN